VSLAAMTVTVVHLLEMVDVEQQQRQLFADAHDAVAFALQHHAEMLLVGNAGETVARRQFAEAVDHGLQAGNVRDHRRIQAAAISMAQQPQSLVELQLAQPGQQMIRSVQCAPRAITLAAPGLSSPGFTAQQRDT